MYKKYIPLEPLVESPNTSWGEIAQKRLLESELTGKGYQQPPKGIQSTPNRPPAPLLDETYQLPNSEPRRIMNRKYIARNRK